MHDLELSNYSEEKYEQILKVLPTIIEDVPLKCSACNKLLLYVIGGQLAASDDEKTMRVSRYRAKCPYCNDCSWVLQISANNHFLSPVDDLTIVTVEDNNNINEITLVKNR